MNRCFVSRAPKGEWKCHNDQCAEVLQGRARSSSTPDHLKCMHITTVLGEKFLLHGTNQKRTCLSKNVLREIPFPPSVMVDFENHVVSNKLDKIIHRVSDKCFVVRTVSTSEAPLGLLHVRVDRKKCFHCSCNKFRRMTAFCGATTAPKLSKRCIHIYICLWAVFSNGSMKNELSLCLFDASEQGKVVAKILCSLLAL